MTLFQSMLHSFRAVFSVYLTLVYVVHFSRCQAVSYPVDVTTVPDLVTALNDTRVTNINVKANLSLTSREWKEVVILKRNVTISGDPTYPIVDLNYLPQRIRLAANVFLTFENLELQDIIPRLSTSLSLVSLSPNSSTVVMRNVLRRQATCLPRNLRREILLTSPRPSRFPGEQVFDYVNTTWCRPEDGNLKRLTCFEPPVGRYVDVVTTIPFNDESNEGGYSVWYLESYLLCDGFITETCINSLGPVECFNRGISSFNNRQRDEGGLPVRIIAPVAVVGGLLLLGLGGWICWRHYRKRSPAPDSKGKDMGGYRRHPSEGPAGSGDLPSRGPEGLVLGRLLGSGSYGRVYEGRWQNMQVAVKVLVNDGLTIERVNNEIKLSMSFRHPNIVQSLHCTTIKRTQTSEASMPSNAQVKGDQMDLGNTAVGYLGLKTLEEESPPTLASNLVDPVHPGDPCESRNPNFRALLGGEAGPSNSSTTYTRSGRTSDRSPLTGSRPTEELKSKTGTPPGDVELTSKDTNVVLLGTALPDKVSGSSSSLLLSGSTVENLPTGARGGGPRSHLLPWWPQMFPPASGDTDAPTDQGTTMASASQDKQPCGGTGGTLQSLVPSGRESYLQPYGMQLRPRRARAEVDSGDYYESWILQEYCDQGSLSSALLKGYYTDDSGLVLIQALLLRARDVARGMEYLHNCHVCHGDLKCENVLLVTDEEDPYGHMAKVADFGLSRAIAEGKSHLSTRTYGTVTHMPPELLLEGRLAPPSDVYSFGIILWEMMTGRSPFKGMTAGEVIQKVVVQDVRPEFPKYVPEAVQQLAHDCWQRQPLKRPRFNEIVARLNILLDNVEDLQAMLQKAYHNRGSPDLSTSANFSDEAGDANEWLE